MSAALPITAVPACASGWQAMLDLRFGHRAGQGSVLSHARHSGPLRVQKPLHPEGPGICHAVLLHPPGGVAGGDQLQIDVTVEPGAHALLTTPGATRWYKSQGRPAAQRVRLRVEEGAILEWLPQENMLFAGADATMALDLDLAPGARAIGWDAVVLGRYGAGEHWNHTGAAPTAAARPAASQPARNAADGRCGWSKANCTPAMPCCPAPLPGRACPYRPASGPWPRNPWRPWSH